MTTRIKKEEITVYILSLSKEEAQALFEVLHRVGGNPHTSLRRHLDPIFTDLRWMGFEPRVPMKGTIYFE